MDLVRAIPSTGLPKLLLPTGYLLFSVRDLTNKLMKRIKLDSINIDGEIYKIRVNGCSSFWKLRRLKQH